MDLSTTINPVLYPDNKNNPNFTNNTLYNSSTNNSLYQQNNPNNLLHNYLIIDSSDRDWYQQLPETPTNFTVKLGASEIGNKNCLIKTIMRNVVSIRVDKLIMPNRQINHTYHSNSATRLNDEPYLTIQFNTITDTDYGTSNNTDHAVAIMTPLIPFPTGLSNISSLEFKNSNSQQKNYIGLPKASIDRLDISILTANGNNPNIMNDILNINRIFSTSNSSSPTANSVITIQTNTFFNSNEYQNGDLIKIRNFVFHNNSYNECFILNNFINRTSGHRIVGIGKSSGSYDLFNQIYISVPQYYSNTTGVLTYENWYADFLLKVNFTSTVDDNTGKLINTNLQTRLLISFITIPNILYENYYQMTSVPLSGYPSSGTNPILNLRQFNNGNDHSNGNSNNNDNNNFISNNKIINPRQFGSLNNYNYLNKKL